jgi:hypothetical protein
MKISRRDGGGGSVRPKPNILAYNQSIINPFGLYPQIYPRRDAEFQRSVANASDVIASMMRPNFSTAVRLPTRRVLVAMSALPPKADMCSAPAHVRFVPEADIGTNLASKLFDHLVGAGKECGR